MAARKVIHTLLSALAFGALLVVTTGCNTDTRGSSSPSLASTDMVEVRAMGSVGDGPIANARIRILSASGQVLRTGTSSATADYDISFRTQGRHYPLKVIADQGTDLVTMITPDFALVSGILSPSVNGFTNLNPYTTLVFLAAEKSGGVNSNSVAAANAAVLSRYGFGLDTSLVPDPLTTPMDGSNVHVIVKASETMGEMIRRTRNAMNQNGTKVHGDDVVAALAADLVDGWIDGNGAAGHNARIAAIANVATAAVMVQAMANRLEWHHSTGATKDITGDMDRAIRTVRPNAPTSSNTENVPIPQEALDQTIRALEAASLLVTDTRIAQTINVLRNQVQPGAKPSDVRPLLPNGIDSVLNLAVTMAADADTATVAEINDVARFGLPAEPAAPAEPEAPLAPAEPEQTDTPDSNDGGVDGDGNTEDGDTGDGNTGDSNTGDNNTGDSNTGDSNTGDSNTGDSNTGDSNIGDSNTGDSNTGETATGNLGTAMVAWTPPTQYSDGTAITDLAGHRIYYGKDPNALTRIVDVPGMAYTEQYINNLDPGTWYFAVTAYNAKGSESRKSNIKTKTIY